ncbi:F5/8 type C domain [Candidatus Ornithobacterium hominis]|uniref:F5/8 type C domain n=1 Tax=Candidatus Ornithobacterium hominis TaxID=2497989 RepID=A0A383TYV7_9FLAO|nr:discoidin domain-containing protein [Candidatus Ornithobacterium hominis]MCT7904083.1 discoidin domain-containing protein [Candidatus Ornithobacterium hominis]SZD72379.1 F5/8 type C domain [Candidatus Ornithobacterium hominis]
MNNYRILILLFSMIFFASCQEDESIYMKEYSASAPGGITNITSKPKPGQIVLHWDKKENSKYEYVKVSYFDHKTQKKMHRNASKFADSILIPGTLQKFGDYEFTLQPFNANHKGGEVFKFTAQSGRAFTDTIFIQHAINLTADQLSTNAPESREGNLANTLDGNNATYFHSAWSGTSPDVHYFQVDLATPIEKAFIFTFGTRSNGNNYPTKINIQGSNDGNEWEDIKEVTTGLNPGGRFARYTSGVIHVKKPFQKIRYNVTKTVDGRKFFVFSEFGMTNVELQINDPEA